jgi:hypothetical protein
MIFTVMSVEDIKNLENKKSAKRESMLCVLLVL